MPSTEQVKGALTECLPLHLVLWGVVAVLLSWQHFEQDKANRVTFAVLCGIGRERGRGGTLWSHGFTFYLRVLKYERLG